MKTVDKRSKKMDLRIALINHPNPNRVIVNNFSNVYRWNVAESQYWNVIMFLEVVRQNNLWDRLEKLVG
jgi:hypothetical protein